MRRVRDNPPYQISRLFFKEFGEDVAFGSCGSRGGSGGFAESGEGEGGFLGVGGNGEGGKSCADAGARGGYG
jgi:hypothetical protein